jgi:CpeT/CpcT family (DUF1001)
MRILIFLWLGPALLWGQKTPQQQLQEITEQWVGQYDNHRQVAASLSWGGPAAPELTREKRQMTVTRLEAPQFGQVVLYLEEFKASQPGLAHRQRVMGLVWDEASRSVRVQQFFFKGGSTYDRKPLAPSVVASMQMSDFERIDRCDLWATWEEKHQRYRIGMTPLACTYEHPVDKMVYADFEMLLWPGQTWYRDRSIRVANGTVRGEIDGFSWLRFDKVASPSGLTKAQFEQQFPSISRQAGVWKGRFRRYDAGGQLSADFASTITVKFDFLDVEKPYQQTNFYEYADGKTQTIQSSGKVEGARIVFVNDQIEGWAAEVPSDDTQQMSVFSMRYKDGSGLYVHEVVSLSADGRSRHRATQYLKEGKVVRRTLIDEVKQ